MNELERIHSMLEALLAVREHVLQQVPSSALVLNEVTEQIVFLAAKLPALTASQNVGQLSSGEQQQLQSALRDVRSQIGSQSSAQDVLAAARTLVGIVGPWPP